MIKKKFLSIILLCLQLVIKADEGMWMLQLMEKHNISKMHEQGLKLNANEIFDTNQPSLEDAIVIFGEGCTGEFVSEKGLVFTNHHCGFDEIQNLSTLEHNYIMNGFWADSMKNELPCPGTHVLQLERFEDVTDSILCKLSDTLTSEDRNLKINELITTIENNSSDSGTYICEVKSFYEGNQYILYIYTELKDVRLVGAPPSSIGKFGDLTDNWMWPRHAGDFAVFRVYTAPDGLPAEYSPNNIPYKPKKYLNLSLDGIKKGDFAFILGYPGSTSRYSTSYGIRFEMNSDNIAVIKARGKRQEILLDAMKSDSLIQIQYSAKYNKSTNYYKYSIGQNKELIKSDILKKREEDEATFQHWCDSDTVRKKKYGHVLSELQQLYLQAQPSGYNLRMIIETFFSAAEIIDLASDFHYLKLLLDKPEKNQSEINKEVTYLKTKVNSFYKDYNLHTDIKILKAMVEIYRKEIPSYKWPPFYDVLDKKYNGNIDLYIDKIFSKSIFTDKTKVLKFLDNPQATSLEKDRVYQISSNILDKYFEAYAQFNNIQERINNLNHLYLKAYMEMSPEKFLYPDANFTMRLTYGSVKDYYPREAVHYDYYTTLKGLMEKEDSTDYEYQLPVKLKNLYNESDYGIYGKNDIMPVCFITDNDISGGNSGSPVMNSKGEMIGIAFDGNWEAMSSDFAFNNELQRCICVDIRYILFIIDKFAGAKHILNELQLNVD